MLAGVEIPAERGLEGHSDADLVSHAVTDALLGAAGMEDIGHLFPSDDPALAGASSIELLRQAWGRVRAARLGARERRRDRDHAGAAPRAAPRRDARVRLPPRSGSSASG